VQNYTEKQMTIE